MFFIPISSFFVVLLLFFFGEYSDYFIFWLSLLAAYFRAAAVEWCELDSWIQEDEKKIFIRQKFWWQQKQDAKKEWERKKITFDFYENEYMHGQEVMIKFYSLFLYFFNGNGRRKKKILFLWAQRVACPLIFFFYIFLFLQEFIPSETKTWRYETMRGRREREREVESSLH